MNRSEFDTTVHTSAVGTFVPIEGDNVGGGQEPILAMLIAEIEDRQKLEVSTSATVARSAVPAAPPTETVARRVPAPTPERREQARFDRD